MNLNLFLEKTITLPIKSYVDFNPEIDHLHGLFKRPFDDCKKCFHRFKNKCVFVAKCLHETNGTTFYFTLKNIFEDQYDEIKEPDELGNQSDEFSEGECENRHDCISKSTIKNLDTMI